MTETKREHDLLDLIKTLFLAIALPIAEFVRGYKTKTIPWGTLLAIGIGLNCAVLFRLDLWILKYIGLQFLYPKGFFRVAYHIAVIASPFYIWGLALQYRVRNFKKRLTEIFVTANLKSPMGRYPGFVFDRPVDEYTRKLRLVRNNFSVTQFETAKDVLASGLQVYIDEIKENRERGTVDLLYSHYPMPNEVGFALDDVSGSLKFIVGQTRSEKLTCSLRETPHLLIAGQTGGGKSTLLRQAITSLYLGDKATEFILIDLKGGLEFQLFENLKRIEVVPSIGLAVASLKRVRENLDSRMQLLKSENVKDLETLYKKKTENKPTLNRTIIIVDEAAEMFLAGAHAETKDIQEAKRALSQIARQGRSVGVHLIIATQRPDAKSLDPQVKANLTGVVCFQMPNDSSSITVLGNGRATDLPPIPGRAIWKSGVDQREIQTPYLNFEDAERLLEPFRAKAEETKVDGELPKLDEPEATAKIEVN